LQLRRRVREFYVPGENRRAPGVRWCYRYQRSFIAGPWGKPMRSRAYRLLATTAFIIGYAQVGLTANLAKPVYKAPPAPVAVSYDWTGFYVGIHGGGAWARKEWVA